LFLCWCAACPGQSDVPQRTPPKTQASYEPNLTDFLPANATLLKQLKLNFKGGTRAIAIAYAWDGAPEVKVGVGILTYGKSGWVPTFEEHDSVINGGGASAAINIEKVRSSDGQDGAVVVLQYSGAGTATDWHVLTLIEGKITRLDSSGVRDRVLKKKGYVYMGYNGVKVTGDLVVENLAGYSPGRARCCPDRPSINVNVKFTGSSLRLDSVKELPFTASK